MQDVKAIGMTVILSLVVVSSPFAKRESSFLEDAMHERTYKGWLHHYIPLFAPTKTDLEAKLRKDPDWQLYFSRSFSDIQAGAVAGKESVMPSSAGTVSGPVKKENLTVPAGTTAMVRVVSPGTNVETNDSSVRREQSRSWLTSQEIAVPGRQEVFENTPSPLMDSNYWGLWKGQYRKLIEYFNPDTNTWNASKNSLRDLPVEMDFQENGTVRYALPDRKGLASYAVKEGLMMIFCEDVRIRGDYEVEEEKSLLSLRTQRILVENKMRVSLEFKLQPEQDRANRDSGLTSPSEGQ